MKALRVNVEDLISFAGDRSLTLRPGADDLFITGVEPIDIAAPEALSFCRFADERGRQMILESSAGAMIIPNSLMAQMPRSKVWYIGADLPRLELVYFLRRFWIDDEWHLKAGGELFVIDEASTVHDSCSIGPFTVIGPGVTIKEGCQIGSGSHIEHASIGRDTTIGNNVSIGGRGFGYETDDRTGEILQFPHIGKVSIGDRVEIGSSVCIDRAALGVTEVGDDTKIDNLANIAHNVKIGKRCKIITLAFVGGSTIVGDDCWIAPAAALRDWIQVDKGAVVGLGAIVTKNVEAHTTVVGNPARAINSSLARYK